MANCSLSMRYSFCYLYFLEHTLFDTDATYLLTQHGASDKATYGYYFRNFIDIPRENRSYSLEPSWVDRKADHGDELFYVFGMDRYDDNLTAPIRHSNIHSYSCGGTIAFCFIIRCFISLTSDLCFYFSS